MMQTDPGQKQASRPAGSSMFSRIQDASSAVAYQDLGSVRLAFKVRYIGVADAARLGILLTTLYGFIESARKPAPEDLDGLAAAELEARKQSEQERLDTLADTLQKSQRVVRAVVTHVQDLDDPDTWHPITWVDTDDEEGDDEDGVRLCLERVLRIDGLAAIMSAALAPAQEVAGLWGPFRR
jgi:hypothetical protein